MFLQIFSNFTTSIQKNTNNEIILIYSIIKITDNFVNFLIFLRINSFNTFQIKANIVLKNKYLKSFSTLKSAAKIANTN